jgi:hydroxyacylglutathione hydrolase
MLFKRIESIGLAHYSYIIGDRNESIVIDPRRDCDVYLEKTYNQGLTITHILETHRNEDYVIGSKELASRTGAEVWHADSQWGYKYGQSVEDGQKWKVGRFTIQAIHSPGHTPGSMSYLLYEAGGNPWMIFTGDALFSGDVGRVDLLGMDRADEMAGLLYDTLFNRILPLGDQVIIFPAHGAGSVCGTAIADRKWSTIGLERKLNPKLQYTNRNDFISHVAKKLERPPYFKQMEKLNLEGAPLLNRLPAAKPLAPRTFDEKMNNSIVLDTRMELCFSAAHVPNSLSIWLQGLSSFAGWFLPYDKPILLVHQTDKPGEAVKYLIRLGFDDIAGYLAGGMLFWHTAGMESYAIKTVTVQNLCRLLDNQDGLWILDVRSDEELNASGEITGAHHIHITQLPQHMDELPKDRNIYIFCGSGLRSMIAASLLQRQDWKDLVVVLGGLAGWNSVSCPIKQ